MLRNDPLEEKVGFMSPWSSERWIPFSQGGLRIFLNLLLFSLPLAHITAVREITLGLGFFFWVLLMVLNKRILWPRTPIDWPLIFWLVCVFASLLWAVNPAYSFKKIIGEVLKGMVVFYLLAYATQESDHRKQLLFSLTVGNLLMVLYALWDFWQVGGSFGDYSIIRARSLHQGYPEFGTYLITVLPFFLVSFFSPLMKSFRWVLGSLIGLNLFCIYITFGRAMWLAAAVELLLVGWMVNKKKIVLIFVVGLLFFAFIIPKTVWFHGERINPSEGIGAQEIGGTGGDLIEIWKRAFRFFSERPFQGIGYGRNSFSEAFPHFRASHQPLLWHAHNTFLNIAFQTGIQGLIAFLWLIGAILVNTYRRGKAGPGSWSGLLNFAVWAMVIGFFIRNCFDDLYVDDSLLLFWFLVGAALAPFKED
ncbi:MAG: O-antigen ligase family protein [Thermodesulfobacteriota bacterium]